MLPSFLSTIMMNSRYVYLDTHHKDSLFLKHYKGTMLCTLWAVPRKIFFVIVSVIYLHWWMDWLTSGRSHLIFGNKFTICMFIHEHIAEVSDSKIQYKKRIWRKILKFSHGNCHVIFWVLCSPSPSFHHEFKILLWSNSCIILKYHTNCCIGLTAV